LLFEKAKNPLPTETKDNASDSSSLFFDFANASTHTNYLIQIVKELIEDSPQQRSGSLAEFNHAEQAFFQKSSKIITF